MIQPRQMTQEEQRVFLQDEHGCFNSTWHPLLYAAILHLEAELARVTAERDAMKPVVQYACEYYRAIQSDRVSDHEATAPPADASKVSYPRYVRFSPCRRIYKIISPSEGGEQYRILITDPWRPASSRDESWWNAEIASGRATLITAEEAGDAEPVKDATPEPGDDRHFCPFCLGSGPFTDPQLREHIHKCYHNPQNDEIMTLKQQLADSVSNAISEKTAKNKFGDMLRHSERVRQDQIAMILRIQSEKNSRLTPEQKPESGKHELDAALANVKSLTDALFQTGAELSTAQSEIATLTAKLARAEKVMEVVERDGWRQELVDAIKSYREGAK